MLDSFIFGFRKIVFPEKVKLLSVGIENGYAGSCPGTMKAATKLFEKIKPRCSYSKLLTNGSATKTAVLSEMQKVCNSDLAIIIFNCHGGQKSGHLNETDGKDEFVALFDQPLVDNEIWNVVSKAKGRVFMIFDCCHSETMFRDCLLPRQEPVDLICWSACADNEVSYGVSTKGGRLISSILKNVNCFDTYDSAWKKIFNDKELRKYEIPTRTILKNNTKFKDKKLFS